MDQAFLIMGGVLLSLAFIALVRWLHPRHELIVYGIALAATAGAYVVFALLNGATSALPHELLGVILYGGLGLAGLWCWPLLIALGSAGHVAWDLASSGGNSPSYAPSWWPTVCVGTDLFLAGYITALVWPKKS